MTVSPEREKKMQLLTTKQMADLLNVNEKTFRLAVKKQNLPFYQVGNSKRFNPDKVLARIEAVEVAKSSAETKVKKKSVKPSADKARFAEMLELV